ncbi:MAG: hypothetical protein P8124_06250 [Gammaproteobacteria bacterium]
MARRIPKTPMQSRGGRTRRTDDTRPAATVPLELLCAHWQRSRLHHPPHLQELRLSPPPMEEHRDHDLPEDARRFLALHGVIA